MLGLFDGVPTFCPQCGRKLTNIQCGTFGRRFYLNGRVQSCACGCLFQLAATSDLIKTANKAGGNLDNYALQESGRA